MNIREFMRKSQFPILLALGTYPLDAVALAFFAPKLLPYAWVMPAVYAVLAIIMLVLPAKPRILLSICGALLMILPCALFLTDLVRNITLTIAAAYAGMLFWSLFMPGWDSRTELSVGWLSLCLFAGLIGCFFAMLAVPLEPYAWGIRLSFLGFVLLAMLSLNRGSLNLAMRESRGFTASMLRKNLLLTVSMFAIALIIALIPALGELVRLCIIGILRLILALQNLGAEETTGDTTAPPASVEDWQSAVLDGMEIQQTSAQTFAIMTALVLVVLIPGLIFLLYRLGKLMITGLHRLVQLFDKAAHTQQADFFDEITDTREDTHRAAAGKKMRPRLVWPRSMTPTEQIRYRYRRLLARHPEWKRHDTARETLPEEAAKLYERARYSDHPITAADANRFQNETK